MKLASKFISLSALTLVGMTMVIVWGANLRGDEQASGLTGTWKLVVLAFGDDEFAIVKVDGNDDKPAASIVSTQGRILGNPNELKIGLTETSDESLGFTLKGPGGANRFDGKLAKEGPDAGRILGGFTFRGDIYPARLERTTSQKVADMKPSDLIQEFSGAARENNPKTKVQKLRDAIKKHAGSPTNHLFYGELLSAAEAAGLATDEVAGAVGAWIKEAEPYGQGWVKEVRQKALKAVHGGKTYTGLTIELAQQAEKEISEETNLDEKAAVVGILARAARLAGKTDLASDAEARSAKLEARLDEQYHKKVPPFKPEPFKGRKADKANRVVLMELFTGSQCPPCVAADVGFDALLKTYKPTEMIGLQYHLHIPGPDPLTNKDTLARQEYYGSEIQGTPSTFFNGQSQAGGGGPMQASEQKYREFREIIEKQLETPKSATITLTATRAGDDVVIHAEATVTGKPAAVENDKLKVAATGSDTKTKESAKESAKAKPRLRLVLTEESIRYVGGNKLRYHHHVVRDFPGGMEGTDLSSGSGELTVKLSLADLKRDIEEYLSSFAKEHAFPNPLPELAMKNLSVVAFVQDDGDKQILDAVSIPVAVKNP